MTVSAHVAPHPDVLVRALCERLRSDPLEPFSAEVVAVPTRGIERWLTQRIALELAELSGGIAANIEFPSPGRLVRNVAEQFPDLARSIETWEGPSLLTAVMAAVDETLAEPWMTWIRRHLDFEGSSRMAAALKITRLFTSYSRRRPEMILAWAGDALVGPDLAPLADRHLWQPRLWRVVRDRLGVPTIPELGDNALDPVREGIPELAERVAVYGLTAADPFDLDVLVAIGATRDVHLHLLHPSPALWEELATKHAREPIWRNDDPTPAFVKHPILRGWGRDSRELQLVLARHGITARPDSPSFDPTGSEPTVTLLTRLQADVRANRGTTVEPVGLDDRSVQIHVCHGARRQVEVLRDAILHVLADDPTLEPRDIVIMTPDLAGFAPLLEAGFPRGQTEDGLPDLRVRIADRSPAATNPLVRFTAGILDAIDGRLETSVIRELVTLPMVQHRFGFDTETAGSIISIIDDANIAWGLDASHRAEWGLGEIADRTWRRGLDRALASVFYSDSTVRMVGDVATLDGIEGQEARPVGILAAIMDRFSVIREALTRSMPMSAWASTISGAVHMLADLSWDEEWQWARLERLLAETFPTVEAGPDPIVTLVECRRAMAAWTEDRPSPLHFRTGDVTVCTLAPMRSVPYRVVCLLGMDDDRFPRRGRSDADDLLRDHELVGDNDRSGEDRQLLLDAVMAAGDHLIITYSGRDEITNADYPPAVPIAELIDELSAMSPPSSEPFFVTQHPLQSFSDTVFAPDALKVKGSWGFDAIQLEGALAIHSRDPTIGTDLARWPGADLPDTVRLGDLIAFLKNPVVGFAKATIGFTIPEVREIIDDGLPVEVVSLEAWAIKERLLRGLELGYSVDELIEHAQALDAFPPGELAIANIDRAKAEVAALWKAAKARGYDPGRHRRFRGSLSVDDRLVEGSVIADPERCHLPRVTPSRIKPKDRLSAYIELCFLTALEPDLAWHAMLLGRSPTGSGLTEVRIGPLGNDHTTRVDVARTALANLVELYELGHRRPLALPCATGHAWRWAASNPGGAWNLARTAFETDQYSAEGNESMFQLIFPEVTDFGALLTDTEFRELSCRLWDPIVSAATDHQV